MIKLGTKIGKLTVVEMVVGGNANTRRYRCLCDCGNEKITSEDNLRREHTRSCGCLVKENCGGASKFGTKRNESKTRLYKIWSQMYQRCYVDDGKTYKNYGGRGITICDEWLYSFVDFKQWAINNGYRDDLTLDRVDVNGSYSPNNCRWATKKEQSNNRRNNKYVLYAGNRMTISEYADIANLPYWKAFRIARKKVGDLKGVV